MNTKNLIPGNTYRLYFKNGRSVVAEYTTMINHAGIDKYRFVICESATLFACDWDFWIC